MPTASVIEENFFIPMDLDIEYVPITIREKITTGYIQSVQFAFSVERAERSFQFNSICSYLNKVERSGNDQRNGKSDSSQFHRIICQDTD